MSARFEVLVVFLCVAGAGCASHPSSTGLGSSSAGSTGFSTSGRTAASASSGSNGGSASGGGSSGSIGTTGAGSSTGTATGFPPPTFIDGGYVACSLETDAGVLVWECSPGTYVCATDGTTTCAQCLSDTDCANDDLPTFDPRRPHCDLSSGVAGYQGYCQECLTSGQCAGNDAGPYCDLDPKDVTVSIVTLGFEACRSQPVGCVYGTVRQLGGECVSTSCRRNSDCANALTPQQQSALFCVNGACATAPTGDACPNCLCFAGCGQPGPQPLVECDAGTTPCSCLGGDQCGGLWPICEFTWGTDAGTCGCDSDEQCGDAGFKCMVMPPNQPGFGGSFCGISCNDPRFPGCGVGPASTPLCDTGSGLCTGCGSDDDCRTKVTGLSVGPDCRVDGACGCAQDRDCPSGDTCQHIDVQAPSGGGLLGLCDAPPPTCNPKSCFPRRCEADSGACGLLCTVDEDCWSFGDSPICDPDGGVCVGCYSDEDCIANGGTRGTYCDLSTRQCGRGCAADADCEGNSSGPQCYSSDSTCGCAKSDDCSAGQGCLQYSPSAPPSCSSYCQTDSDCPAGFFCDPQETCRPRCDPGHTCQPPDMICDTGDVGMMNEDAGVGDDAGAVTWCYQCLSAGDCPKGEECQTTTGFFQCGECQASADCPPGLLCYGDACRTECVGAACPSGQVCNGADGFCYDCLGPSDCPDDEGCFSGTRTCGSACLGPSVVGGSEFLDCPPAAVCSNFWSYNPGNIPGVCLQNCDFSPCPSGRTCAILPDLTPDHHYCFGCLADADCTDAGAGAWCDVSVHLTFTCQQALASQDAGN